MSAVVICSTEGKCLPVLCASISFYLPTYWTIYLSGSNIILPKHKTVNIKNTGKTFGESYNAACHVAMQDHEDLLVLNDDVVLNPSFWQKITEDLQIIPEKNRGWVAARADFARGMQNVRWRHDSDPNFANSFPSEEKIIETDIIAPYAAYIHRDAWIDFPPLNNYSDDVQCLDMRMAGTRNFISRAYVHHVGGASTGRDWRQMRADAIPWIAENRPEYAAAWFPEIQKAS
jgi:GT2 family glycosyltransferase